MMIAKVYDQRYFDDPLSAKIAAAAQVAADASAMAMKADQQVAAAKLAWQADVSVTYNTVIALSLAPRTATFSISGAKVNDRVYVHRRGKPTLAGVNVAAGVILEATGLVPSDGNVEIYHVIPAVGVGQTLLIPLRLLGYRPAS